MARLTDLERQNPNLRQQYEAWRVQRQQRGESVTDYQAFRAHLRELGAPDPGDEAFDEFATGLSGAEQRQPVGAGTSPNA